MDISSSSFTFKRRAAALTARSALIAFATFAFDVPTGVALTSDLIGDFETSFNVPFNRSGPDRNAFVLLSDSDSRKSRTLDAGADFVRGGALLFSTPLSSPTRFRNGTAGFFSVPRFIFSAAPLVGVSLLLGAAPLAAARFASDNCRTRSRTARPRCTRCKRTAAACSTSGECPEGSRCLAVLVVNSGLFLCVD